MKKLFTFIACCMLLCTVCIAQTKNVEYVYLKGPNMEFKYRKITCQNPENNFVYIEPVGILNQTSYRYPLNGGIYYRLTKIEGNIQDAADEVRKNYPNEKLPEKIRMEIYFSLQKETIGVTYSYDSPNLEIIISPNFMEDLTKAILKNQKLMGVKKISNSKPEFPIEGVSIMRTVRFR